MVLIFYSKGSLCSFVRTNKVCCCLFKVLTDLIFERRLKDHKCPVYFILHWSKYIGLRFLSLPEPEMAVDIYRANAVSMSNSTVPLFITENLWQQPEKFFIALKLNIWNCFLSLVQFNGKTIPIKVQLWNLHYSWTTFDMWKFCIGHISSLYFVYG